MARGNGGAVVGAKALRAEDDDDERWIGRVDACCVSKVKTREASATEEERRKKRADAAEEEERRKKHADAAEEEERRKKHPDAA